MNRTLSLDIVIPSRGEEVGIGATLAAILADGQGLNLDVVLVLNGEGREATLAAAKPFQASYAEHGHSLKVVCIEQLGKPAALNAGDAERSGNNVVYLDADAIVLPGTLRGIAIELSVEFPRLTGARLEIIRPDGFFSSRYSDVWQALPGMQAVIGAGCYAVNAQGRARWAKFPNLTADDAFVASLFAPNERTIHRDAAIWFRMARGLDLLSSIKRWRQGNRALQKVSKAQSQPKFGLRWLVKNLRLVPALGPFLFVKLLSYLVPTNVQGHSWRPSRSEPLLQARERKMRIRVVVVTYNSEQCIVQCLSALRSCWAYLDLIVVDNGSSDRTIAMARLADPRAKIIEVGRNIGFSAAVNTATGVPGDFDYVLLCNPDTVPERDAIDFALSLAIATPRAIVGGRMIDGNGKLDHTSALAYPNLWHGLVFASAIAALPGFRILDPDWLCGWDREGTRAVPALTGAFTLISAELWRELHGLDTHFFLYGEDVDFSVRAAASGATLLCSGTVRYTHLGGASSRNQTERMIRILRGKRQLYERYIGLLGPSLLLVGVSIRATIERLLGRQSIWSRCWAERRVWMYEAANEG